MDAVEILVNVYHSINSFMATDSGELFKKFVELFLFATVAYMIASEYGRSKENHLKYLLVGFTALALDKFIMTIVFSLIVFGNVHLLILNPFLPILNLFLEIFALILLTNSFIYPIFADKVDYLKKKITKEIFIVIAIVLVIEVFWLVRTMYDPTAAFRSELSYLILELLKIIVLYSPIYYIISNLQKISKYGPHIIIAFVVYMITPVANVINVVFYGGLNNDLRVFAHPFPFISILLFTRIIYLKLVDKATLKRELSDTKNKYVQEYELGKMKDEFVSTVSHELKTPLTSMKLYLSLLNMGKFGKMSKKQFNAVKIVEKESNRLTNLITDILSLSKMESKKRILKTKDTNIHKLVKDNLYYNMAEQKGLVIINDVPENFMAQVDPEKFKQVFINLFSNAVNYAKKKICVSVKKNIDKWDFIVEDDGEGIPQNKLNKLFDKFYKVGDYLTKDKKGTGLGLAIVKNIVELHNGKVWAESEEGKGTKFIVRIPF